MKIAPESTAAIEALGYTPDEARFLYIVATFSGYFVPRQYNAFALVRWGWRSNHFTGKLESRGHALWREYPHLGGVYHLCSKTLYRLIDKSDLRNRRRHSTEFIRTRLTTLDFIVANPNDDYFELESEKVRYFHDELGISKNFLPAKAYGGSPGSERSVRYFIDQFPMFPQPSSDHSASLITFSYVDAGNASLTGFRHYLDSYRPLFAKLPGFRLLYLSNSSVHFSGAEKCFSTFCERAFREDFSADLLRYFALRAQWDAKRFGELSSDDIEWLERASARFQGPDTEQLYEAWRGGRLETVPCDVRATPDIRFECRLVQPCTGIAKQLERTG